MDFGMPFLIEAGTQENCIELCGRLGLRFVEWNMNFPQCQTEAMDPEKLREAAQRAGIYYTLHLEENLNVCEFNPKVRRAYLETAMAAVKLAKELQSPVINMHLAKGIYITLPGRRRYLYEEYADFYLQHLRSFRDACECAIGDADIMMAVENTEGFEEYERRALELLLESPRFGLTLDIGHSRLAGDVDLPFYEAHKDRLIHMHAHDSDSAHNHLAFGDGDIDLGRRLSMARDAGCRVVLETKTVEALSRTVEYLRGSFPEL